VTACVIDASSLLAWCFEDEGGPEADALVDRVAADGASVPDPRSFEIANGLVAGERRRRISAAESATFIAMLEELPIVADLASGGRALQETTSLAREHRLSAYDAAYLELGMRLDLPLATADCALAVAATRAGVALLGDVR
jgi:predicted nucleic acid-binding protein